MKKTILTLIALCSMAGFANQVYDPTQPKQIYVAMEQQVVDELMTSPIDTLRLQGILAKKSSRVAIISGELYNKGDKVEGYLISEIHKDHVVMTGTDTQKLLYVYE